MQNNAPKADIGILIGDTDTRLLKEKNPHIEMWVVIGASKQYKEEKIVSINSTKDIEAKISYVKDLQYKQFELFDPHKKAEQHKELIVSFSQRIIELKKQNIVIDNTKVKKNKHDIENIISNFNQNIQISLLSGLKAILPEHCLCIAAGPSLEKDITTLKQNQDKIFTICCDAAVNICIKNNIIPDILTIVESNRIHWDLFFKEIPYETLKQTKIITTPWVDPEILKNYPGEIITIDTDFPESFFWNHMKKSLYLNKKSYNFITLNVGFFNVSLAYYLGFKNILTTGLDLSFPDNISHAEGVAHRETNINTGNSSYKSDLSVLNNQGKQNSISPLFKLYKENFEAYARYIKSNVINCSQIGAALANTKYETLQNYILKNKIFKTEIVSTKKITLKQQKTQKIIIKLINSLEKLNKLCASDKDLNTVMTEMRNFKLETDILANYDHKLMLYAKQHIKNHAKDPNFKFNLRQILKNTSQEMIDFLKKQINI